MWSQGGYGRTIITNRSGLYGALFTDKYGCRAKDTISVQGPPDFSSLPSFCLDICDTSLNTGNYWLPIYIPGNFDTWDWEKELLPGIFTSISSGIGKLPDSVNIIAAARYRLTIKLRGCIYYSELIDVNIIKCTCGCNIQSEFIDTILPIDSCMHHFLAKSILDTCTSLIQYDWFTTYGTTRINSDTFSHRYSKAYERVCLVTRAYDNTTSNYCSDTLCRGRSQSDTLCLKKCQCNVFASFVVDVDSCYAELSIDSIPFDTCDAIYTYHWNFGDGNVYDGLYPPSHHYKMNGRYYACLIVTRINPMGNSCADTFCRYVCITDCSCHCDVSIIQNKTNVATNMNCS